MDENYSKQKKSAGSKEVILKSYNPEWKLIFEKEKQLLRNQLTPSIIDIQHIGSTSIPGMLAKPIIDIGIAVESFERAFDCIKPLEDLDYIYKGENGIPRRHYFVKGKPPKYHLHMLEIKSKEWKNHLYFRDYLTKNSDKAIAYLELKRDLANKFPNDKKSYQAAKADFIRQIIHKTQ